MRGCLQMRRQSAVLAAIGLAAWGLAGCAEGSSPGGMDTTGQDPLLEGGTPVGPPLLGLHRVGNRIQTSDGVDVQLRGVNRSGTEYKCVQNSGIFDGPATVTSVKAMAAWKVNAVRVPLNEDCWLGIKGVSPSYGGDNYRAAIKDYVRLLHAFHIVPILELHWTAPGEISADRLQPLPDVDHAADFWRSVAEAFKDDDGVIFEPFNEPFPDSNRDTEAAWQCWRDGCMANLAPAPGESMPAAPALFAAAGMQMLVDAIRETGATQLILLGGVQYSNALTQWLKYVPEDPLNNLGAAWHIYDNNACRSASCWDGVPTQVAEAYPILVTELGQGDCADTFIRPLMEWLDGKQIGYLAWSWNAYGPCQPRSTTTDGQPWSLIVNYASGVPNGAYALAYFNHLQNAPAAPP